MIVTQVDVFIGSGDERDINVEFAPNGSVRVLFGTVALHWVDEHARERMIEDFRHIVYIAEQQGERS